jgi:hypothetical protein
MRMDMFNTDSHPIKISWGSHYNPPCLEPIKIIKGRKNAIKIERRFLNIMRYTVDEKKHENGHG